MLDVFYHHRATVPFPDWAIRDFNQCFGRFGQSVIYNNHIVYTNLDYFKEYKDKTVFIIGGGPSTMTTDLAGVDRDFTWSINHFFLNDKLKDTKVDLAMILGEPNINSPEFLEYREKFQPYIALEVHDRWFNHTFDDYDKYCAMHTKFYGRLGAGLRMILFASFLGCKEIKFTGLDGAEEIFKGNHAFQPGKNTLPSVYTNAPQEVVLQDWKEQNDYFWEYTQELFPAISYVNLGGGERYHEKIKR